MHGQASADESRRQNRKFLEGNFRECAQPTSNVRCNRARPLTSPSSFTLPHVLVCKEILIVVGILDYITYKFDRF